jgi:hypothetical protein
VFRFGLTESRLALVKDHLKDGFDDDCRYLSGSLDSSAAVVIVHLMRKEPFAFLHVIHQSDSFDPADRLFISLPIHESANGLPRIDPRVLSDAELPHQSE